MSYGRFFAMIGTSTVVMFGLMYLNTYLWPHALFSETRAYMAVLMGGTMAVIMLGFMLSMYDNKTLNAAIFAGSLLVFGAMLYLVRSQATVGDVSFLRAMIPHHSIAIMTSSRANLSDPRVRKLADEIIAAQNKEIAEMKYLIADLEGEAGGAPIPERAPGTPAPEATVAEALATVEVPGLDAAALTEAEIDSALGRETSCRFQRTLESPAILAVGPAGEAALMKLNGKLIALSADGAGRFAAEGVSMRVTAADGLPEGSADLLFDLDAGHTVGYRGIYRCGADQ
ncbi:DUF6692 family protein [Marinovum sp.]|uniref:DUF6692 family protein n=1 Tax=Marinovum sp. TaxID=2024839 RepID=UPI002B270FB9|nr:DUF6692 family protein [Marinovum sp.]